MKARTTVLTVGIAAILAVGGYATWKSTWVRSLFLRDSDNREEMERAAATELKNVTPPDAEVGSPGWRGETRQGVAAKGAFRTDWDKNPPKELWRVPIGGGYGSCAVVGSKLYVQDKQNNQERVACFDVANGKPVWVHAYNPGATGKGGYNIGPRATPTVVGNWVYTVGEGGKLLALEGKSDGVNVRWEHDLVAEFEVKIPDWGIAGSPLVYRDLVIVQPGGKQGAVVAFDKTTGELRWKAGSGAPSYSSPVVAPIAGLDTVFAFMGDALLAVRPTDGKVMSSYRWATQYGANIATPLVLNDEKQQNDYVFISAAYGQGSAKLRAERAGDEVKLIEVWKRRGFQNHHATSVYKDKHLFGISGQTGSGGLRCFDFDKGEEVWDEARVGQASIVLAGDHLLLQRAAGELWLVAADTTECKVVGKTKKILSGNNNWATPTLVDGRIYLRDEQNVVCLDVKP